MSKIIITDITSNISDIEDAIWNHATDAEIKKLILTLADRINISSLIKDLQKKLI